MSFTSPTPPRPIDHIGEQSALTRKLIADGCKPKPGALTDAQALVQRLEDGASAGTTNAQRRRLLREAAAFVREHLNLAPNRSSEAA